jgi:hypothetical protein
MHFSGLEAFEGMTAFNQKRKANYRMVRDRWANDDSPETLWGANIRQCSQCGVNGLPARFTHCGSCGAPLKTESKPSARRLEAKKRESKRARV